MGSQPFRHDNWISNGKTQIFSSITFHLKVWSHFDAGSCPGSAIGVRCRLDNTVSGFIHTKNISDKNVKDPSERVQVSQKSNVLLNF